MAWYLCDSGDVTLQGSKCMYNNGTKYALKVILQHESGVNNLDDRFKWGRENKH
jgi:hypothetical protein